MNTLKIKVKVREIFLFGKTLFLVLNIQLRITRKMRPCSSETLKNIPDLPVATGFDAVFGIRDFYRNYRTFS